MIKTECKGCESRHKMLVLFAEKIDEQRKEIADLKQEAAELDKPELRDVLRRMRTRSEL